MNQGLVGEKRGDRGDPGIGGDNTYGTVAIAKTTMGRMERGGRQITDAGRRRTGETIPRPGM
jgi:hypothetical protein